MFQAAAISVGATISSVALAPAATSAGTTPAAASMSAKWISESAVWRFQRDRLEHRLGQERERPLRADDQAPEDLQRLLGVQEGAQAVAGRVLDLELAPDALAQLRVGEQLPADLQQTRGELGGGGGEGLGGALGSGVDHGAVGEHERHRADRAVGVGVDAAAHPAGVVGHHSADAGDVGARRVGPHAPAVAGEHAVEVPEDRRPAEPARARRRSSTRALWKWRRTSMRMPSRLALAVEARAAGAEDDRGAAVARQPRAPPARRRGRAGSPPRAGSCDTGWRRRRSGRGRGRGWRPRPARAPAAALPAAARACRERPNRGRGR